MMNEVRELPRLPDVFNVPDALVQAWMKIPTNQPLTFQVTREHIDQLFFSLTRLSHSNTKLQSCLLLYTQGKLNEANDAMAESQRATVEAENYARQFLAAVISSAVTNAGS